MTMNYMYAVRITIYMFKVLGTDTHTHIHTHNIRIQIHIQAYNHNLAQKLYTEQNVIIRNNHKSGQQETQQKKSGLQN